MSHFIDIEGNRYNRLLVIELDRKEDGLVYWKCKCDCGNTLTVIGRNLKNNHTKSCGCLNKEKLLERNYTHKFSRDRFYKIYHHMLTRCSNKSRNRYHRYGGRGIKIHDRWLKFENFKDDMHDSYLEHCTIYGGGDTSIERLDLDGNYELSNCTWATHFEQSYNTSRNKWFRATSPNGEVYFCRNQKCFARKFDLLDSSLNRCLKKLQIMHKGWHFSYFKQKHIDF